MRDREPAAVTAESSQPASASTAGMGGKRKEVAFISNVRVLATLPPGASLDYVEAAQTIRTLADEISAISEIPNEGVVIHGQLVEQDATLEGLGFRDNDPRGICLVRLNVKETRRLPDGNIGSEVVPAQIGGLLINEYPCMVESETARLTSMQLNETMDKGESLIPPHIYPIMGPEEGVLVHGEGLYHLTYEAQERCSSHLKTLLKNFPKGLHRATSIYDLPVKMPDFSEVTKGLKNPRQFKHAYQFQEQLHAAIQKYHHLSMFLLSQTPKSDDEMTKIETEYNKMQNVLDHFFEPGTLERKDSGEVVIHDKVLEECCRKEDRCMPGSDSHTYYVGPVRNLSSSNSNAKVTWDCQPTDNLVVKLQGITPSTVVGDLVQCYKIVAGNARLNITHLKYAETKFDLDTLVHDMIKKPGDLGLSKFYFSYVEHNTMKMNIDDLVGFIEGEEKPPAKGEGKKKKKPKKKSKAEITTATTTVTTSATTSASSSGSPSVTTISSATAEQPDNGSESWALGKDESPEIDLSSVQLRTHSAAIATATEGEDLSQLGAHCQSESASANETSSESREPLPGDAKRKEERKKIIRELAIVMETAKTMEERLRREENIQEGEEHLNSLENENAEESKKVKETPATHGEKMSTEKPREVASEREKKVAEMQQVLDCKERQAEELRQSVQTMIEEKSKEMSALISSIEQIEDSQAFRKKRISKIDAAVKDLATEMESLNNEKRETVQECDAADENIKKIEKKKKKLENFLQSYSTEANTNIAKLQREIDSLQRLLNAPDNESEPVESEVMTKANPELLQFMERQIDAVEKELECPICLEIASQAPIFKCEEDHLICSKCRVKVRCCPQCREEYPEGPHKRYRGAERQAERLAGMYKERESLLHPR